MKINKKAFTILEMGVVIICISVFIRMTMKLTSLTSSSKKFGTELKLRKIDLALENYIKRHGYLPCPSDITLKFSEENFGKELNTDDGECQDADGLFKYNGIYVGGVPVNALELNSNDAIDLWGNKIIYSVNEKIIKSYSDVETNLCVAFIGADKKYSKIDNVYYALISNGKNKFGAIPSRSRKNLKMDELLLRQQEAVNIFSRSEFLGGSLKCLTGISKNSKNFDDILRFAVYNKQLLKRINNE